MLPIIPKGKILIIGGAEDKGTSGEVEIQYRNKYYKQLEILKELIPKKKGVQKPIIFITTASTDPRTIIKDYSRAFRKIGFPKVGYMNIGNNQEANKKAHVDRIRKAHAVFFSGGDQFRLSTVIGNTLVLDAIRERYMRDKDFIVAGTSAGAMCMSDLMMFEGENNEALLNGTVKISSGLGFLSRCLIDTHFIKRGRFGRLSLAVVMNPSCIGIGLGEDTAMIIRNGNHMECRGSGMVVIIDGKRIGHTNIFYAEQDAPLCIENLTVHILADGNGYLLKERTFLPSKKDLRTEKRLKKSTKPNKGER